MVFFVASGFLADLCKTARLDPQRFSRVVYREVQISHAATHRLLKPLPGAVAAWLLHHRFELRASRGAGCSGFGLVECCPKQRLALFRRLSSRTQVAKSHNAEDRVPGQCAYAL